MKPSFRGKNGISGYLVYLFTLVGFYLIFWVGKDMGFIEDYGLIYNTLITVGITILAAIVASVLIRNLKNLGGEING